LPRRTNTRERLIATAIELFSRQGYSHTGVNEIMQQAKTTSGSFYHFFPTKEDLVLAVVDRIGDSLDTEIFAPDTDAMTDPIERIFAVAAWYRRHLVEHEYALGSPLGTLSAELSESHPQVRERLARLFAGWTDRMQQLIENAGDRISSEVDRRALAEFIMSTLEGAVLQARARRSVAPFDASTSELRRHLAALGGTDRSEPPRASRPRQTPPARTNPVDWRAW
jgi:AcrR family transcriptional regulator